MCVCSIEHRHVAVTTTDKRVVRCHQVGIRLLRGCTRKHVFIGRCVLHSLNVPSTIMHARMLVVRLTPRPQQHMQNNSIHHHDVLAL